MDYDHHLLCRNDLGIIVTAFSSVHMGSFGYLKAHFQYINVILSELKKKEKEPEETLVDFLL